VLCSALPDSMIDCSFLFLYTYSIMTAQAKFKAVLSPRWALVS